MAHRQLMRFEGTGVASSGVVEVLIVEMVDHSPHVAKSGAVHKEHDHIPGAGECDRPIGQQERDQTEDQRSYDGEGAEDELKVLDHFG